MSKSHEKKTDYIGTHTILHFLFAFHLFAYILLVFYNRCEKYKLRLVHRIRTESKEQIIKQKIYNTQTHQKTKAERTRRKEIVQRNGIFSFNLHWKHHWTQLRIDRDWNAYHFWCSTKRTRLPYTHTSTTTTTSPYIHTHIRIAYWTHLLNNMFLRTFDLFYTPCVYRALIPFRSLFQFSNMYEFYGHRNTYCSRSQSCSRARSHTHILQLNQKQNSMATSFSFALKTLYSFLCMSLFSNSSGPVFFIPLIAWAQNYSFIVNICVCTLYNRAHSIYFLSIAMYIRICVGTIYVNVCSRALFARGYMSHESKILRLLRFTFGAYLIFRTTQHKRRHFPMMRS